MKKWVFKTAGGNMTVLELVEKYIPYFTPFADDIMRK